MKFIPRLIIIVSFCVATLGAAGMELRDKERSFSFPPTAIFLLVAGLVGTIVGGALARAARAGASFGAHEDAQRDAIRGEIERIRDRVRDLDQERAKLEREEFRQRIDSLLTNEYFDLTSKHEEIVQLLGFASYARVWDGVAAAERLLSRAWSMATDGHLEEAREELPAARAHLERAFEVLASKRSPA